MEIQALNSSIIKGIYYAYEDSAKFNGFINPIIKPEYLITVNVAKSIREDFDLIIKLEEPTDNFLNESADKLDILNHYQYIKHFKETKEEELRKGRIDIVLYDKDGKKNVLPIEIKGFDTPTRNKQRLFDDINRLLLFMSDDSGHGNIKFSTVAFIQETKVIIESEIAESLLNIKKEYTKIIEAVYGDYLNDFKFEIHTEKVFDNLFKSQAELDSIPTYSTVDDCSLDDIIDEIGLFIGVIISFYKNEM